MALDATELSALLKDKLLVAFPNAQKVDGGGCLGSWADAIAQAVVEHFTQKAELIIPQYTIPAGAVSTGAGPNAIPSPGAIPITQPPTPPGAIK